MKFSINKIILWLKDWKQRILNFDQNKINVITWDSWTGKTSILWIIDYCLLSTEAKIPQKVINENVDRYWLNFTINENTYTIARKSFEEDKKASDDIYFSSIWEVPNIPSSTIENKNLKSILEKEFSINEKLVIPYWWKKIKWWSKISYRYFLLFNTQWENIISNTDNTFFDFASYSDPEKYKEVLDRIFDLVIGANTIEDILMKEKIDSLEKEIDKLNRQKKAFEKEDVLFKKNINDVLLKAKEYNLVDSNIKADDEWIKKLKEVLLNKVWTYKNSYNLANNTNKKEEDSLFDLQKKKITIIRKIQNLKNLEHEYKKQRTMIKNEIDSLYPINYLIENYWSLLETPSTQKLLDSLKEELENIRERNKNYKPIEININPKVKELELQLNKIEDELSAIPIDEKQFSNNAEKFIFIWETKAKIEFYEKEVGNDDFEAQITVKQDQKEELLNNLWNKKSSKDSIMLLLRID